MQDQSVQVLSEVTVFTKYARFVPEIKRRETWEELVTRNMLMHIRKFPALQDEIRKNYQYVFDKKVFPSMRALQFGGAPIELNPARNFNCAYLPIDSWEAFHEIMFLSLSGCGVGFSVQKHHVAKLPALKMPLKKKKRFLIMDSIEGWSDAVKVLIRAYFLGEANPDFDYSDIRKKGTPLKTSGGKAPGPQPLKDCIHNLRKVLDTKESGDSLLPLEVHDMICFLTEAVLSGGIRRSALISLFSADDESMLSCKFGNWWEENPQRARANNSVVLLRHRISKEKFDELWDKIKASNAGEPGIYFSNNAELGTNPCCVSIDSWIMTEDGPQQVKDLIGKKFNAIVEGKSYTSVSDGFWKTGIKKLFKVTTQKGLELKVTADHKLLTDSDLWKPLEALKVGDKLKIANHKNLSWEGKGGNFEEGWLLGSLVGDGFITETYACLNYWGDSSDFIGNVAFERMKNNMKIRSDAKVSDTSFPGKKRVASVSLAKLANSYNIFKDKKCITDQIEQASSEFYKGFIRGFFDADGSIQGTLEKGYSVRLSQINLDNLKKVQRMLLRLGINSTVYETRREAGYRDMPDGKGGMKSYFCQASHELVISKNNIKTFADVINFEEPAKKERLKKSLESYTKGIYTDSFSDAIKSIEYIGEEEVYDVTIDTVHEFDANGLRAHNCEVSLKPMQFCNLTSINVMDVESQEDLNNRSKAAGFIGTLQASYTNFHYLRDAWKETTEKDALLGVSQTGIASKKFLSLNIAQASKVALKENERVSKLIGINKASRVTVTKPEGTLSCVAGTSSGVHAWHSPYYLRRLRFGKNEAIYKYLKEKIPQLVEDDYFKPEEQAVITFPIKAPEGSIFRDESPIDFLDRVKKIHTEWIIPGHRKGDNTNNVSATVSIKEDEWKQVGEWMWQNKESYNGLSVIPADNGSYIQAPFEDCTKEIYESLMIYVKKVDLTEILEEDDLTKLSDQAACINGACELK